MNFLSTAMPIYENKVCPPELLIWLCFVEGVTSLINKTGNLHEREVLLYIIAHTSEIRHRTALTFN